MKAATRNRIQVIEDAKKLENRILIAVFYNVCYLCQRPGQALMNALYNVAPELYFILSESLSDCFNDDSKFPAALHELGFDEARFQKVVAP